MDSPWCEAGEETQGAASRSGDHWDLSWRPAVLCPSMFTGHFYWTWNRWPFWEGAGGRDWSCSFAFWFCPNQRGHALCWPGWLSRSKAGKVNKALAAVTNVSVQPYRNFPNFTSISKKMFPAKFSFSLTQTRGSFYQCNSVCRQREHGPEWRHPQRGTKKGWGPGAGTLLWQGRADGPDNRKEALGSRDTPRHPNARPLGAQSHATVLGLINVVKGIS